MLFFNANFICYYFYPTKKREEPIFSPVIIHLRDYLLTVRSYGFKLAFPDGEGEPLAVDRVDYKQPQAGCMVLGLKSFFFPQGRMVSILPSPKHTKKTALFGAVSFYFN